MKTKKTNPIPGESQYGQSEPDYEKDDTLSQERLQHFSNSDYLGHISAPDGYAYLQGDCGDSMEVFLTIKDKHIKKARFDTLGCGFTVACGNMTMKMAEGKRIPEAMKITSRQIIKALGKILPPAHYHCAEMAEETLKNALRDHLVHGKDSWKKLYRNR